MSDLTPRTGSGGLPPGNTITGGVYNPTAGASTAHPDGFPIGTPVVQSPSADNTVVPGNASSLAGSILMGLAAHFGVPDSPVFVKSGGALTATEAQWDAITGDSGGLVRNAPYYLRSVTEGGLTRSAPSAGGTFKVLVGVAMSSTDFMVRIGSPVAN